MTEKRTGPALGVRLTGVSVMRELTVFANATFEKFRERSYAAGPMTCAHEMR